MRISDWSSDVCSSDLALSGWRPLVEATGSGGKAQDDDVRPTDDSEGRSPASADLTVTQPLYRGGRTVAGTARAEHAEIGRASSRKSVAVRVDLGGRRLLSKNN